MEQNCLLNKGVDLNQEGRRLEQVGELEFISSSSIFWEIAVLGFEVKRIFLAGFNLRVVVDGLNIAYRGIIFGC